MFELRKCGTRTPTSSLVVRRGCAGTSSSQREDTFLTSVWSLQFITMSLTFFYASAIRWSKSGIVTRTGHSIRSTAFWFRTRLAISLNDTRLLNYIRLLFFDLWKRSRWTCGKTPACNSARCFVFTSVTLDFDCMLIDSRPIFGSLEFIWSQISKGVRGKKIKIIN